MERYCKEQGLFRTADTPDPEFTDTLELDLGTVEPSLAGPKRPQDRVPLERDEARLSEAALTAPIKERGYELTPEQIWNARPRWARTAARSRWATARW